MNDTPRASIIIDNYNYGRFLRQAIDSALNQTYPNTEVIVVDDGSTDDSRDVIETYGPRIIPVLKDNAGQASAFNAGFARSQGDVILFLDADDLLFPQAVEKAVPLLADPGVVKVHWPLRVIDERGRESARTFPDEPVCDGCVRALALEKGPVSSPHAPTSGNAWSRRFLEEVFPVQECGDKHGADAYLFTVAEVAGLIRRMAEPLGGYRVHPGAFSARTVEYELQRDIRRYDHHCRVLSNYLATKGHRLDPEVWKGPESVYAWMKQLVAVPPAIPQLVPEGEAFILVDEYNLGADEICGRRAIPFLERDGQYWGPPPDDETAVKEVERLRRAGARSIVFAALAFWWLDCYPGLHRHLRCHFPCVLENDCLVAFDLRASP